MKTQGALILAMLLLFTCSFYGQTCETLTDNSGKTIPQHHSDTKEHEILNGLPQGEHNDSSAITWKCSYTSSSAQWCVTNCSNGATVTPDEFGNLSNIIEGHVTKGVSKGGTAQGANGASASCGGTTATTVVDCLTPGCSVALSIGASANGLNATISFPQTDVWEDSQPNVTTCNPVKDPTFGSAGGGGGGGDPCLGGQGPDPGTGPGFSGGGGGSPDPTCSPIIIDAEGEGFHLTSAAAGVTFDITGTGHPIQMAWTDSHFRNAFLTLPGPDGLVHNGKDLFGNFTQQDPSKHKNGFLALSEFDEPDQGGNGDGVIDEHDAVFSKLRLWIDDNHDGISQPTELHTLAEFGIHSLSVSYFSSRKTDGFGNQFRYKARVNPDKDHRDSRDETASGDAGRWAYDVFLVTKQ